ncbi:MAG: hypothetical protein MJZ09_02215 [Bacteroidales bacterium]|nr:hypothetical protein [Bacteroidales bacterium]
MEAKVKKVTKSFKVPFLVRSGQVLLVARDADAEKVLNEQMEIIVDILDSADFELVYLPMVLSGIMIDAMQYSSPGLAEIDLVGKVSRAIMRGVNVDISECPFLLIGQTPHGQEYVEIADGSLIQSVSDYCMCDVLHNKTTSGILFNKCSTQRDREGQDEITGNLASYDLNEMGEFSFSALEDSDDQDLDEKTRAIIRAIKDLRDNYGVTPADLEKFLDAPLKISKLVVTGTGSIELPDYGAKLDLDKLSEAIYILFLRHPEGIVYKCLIDYRKELTEIYGKIANRGSMQEIAATVEHLVDPFNSGQISIHVSRIKKAFLNVKDDRIAKNYYILGPQGGAKKITLDRSLVSCMV